LAHPHTGIKRRAAAAGGNCIRGKLSMRGLLIPEGKRLLVLRDTKAGSSPLTRRSMSIPLSLRCWYLVAESLAPVNEIVLNYSRTEFHPAISYGSPNPERPAGKQANHIPSQETQTSLIL
jgi:hypothetical protein